jgi:hypothetical protein
MGAAVATKQTRIFPVPGPGDIIANTSSRPVRPTPAWPRRLSFALAAGLSPEYSLEAGWAQLTDETSIKTIY